MLAAWLLLATHLLHLCAGSCYFSAELQGEYLMQTITSGAQTQVQYSVVNITAEAIPMWGLCHHRQGDNVILNDSFNGTACIRCFHLKLHSPNVLQVHTCPTCLDQCYLTEEAARNTCPRGDHFPNNRYKEITLFRTKEIAGGNIKKMFCPIAGRYTFTYNLFNQTDNRVECSPAVSQLENCADRARGPQLDVHFQGCAHQYNEMTFECLGDWAGPNGQRYLALQETSASATAEQRPRYRCALYREDDQRGSIMMAFSSDSTCSTDLYNATYGHMTWNLTAIPSMHWPSVVINSKCSFPYWSQGKWEHLNVNFNSLSYKDHYSYNGYTMRCAQAVDEERFVVFSKNGCGEEVYKCIKMKLRSGNVLEFQLGLTSSIFFNTSLCSDSNFLGNVWVTQARLEGRQVSPCPVTGDYTGFITNDSGLCARMASDQLHPEIMYFTVSDCEQQEVYEEREYQCLGQWEEDGVTYTYTQRKDFGSYECFVGSILSNNEIYIKEAGEHCGRGIDPLRTGMKLQVRVSGGTKVVEPNPPTTQPVTSWYVTKRPTLPTKPWKPITGAPPRHSGISRASPSGLLVLASTVLAAAVASAGAAIAAGPMLQW